MRDYSREFRMEVVQRIRQGEKVPALSLELGIHRKLLYAWMRQVNEGGVSSLRERGRPRKIDPATGNTARQAPDLERTVAQQQLAIEFFRHAFERAGQLTREKEAWRDGVFQTIEAMMERQVGLSVEAMCELARVARSGYYRYLRTRGGAKQSANAAEEGS